MCILQIFFCPNGKFSELSSCSPFLLPHVNRYIFLGAAMSEVDEKWHLGDEVESYCMRTEAGEEEGSQPEVKAETG